MHEISKPVFREKIEKKKKKKKKKKNKQKKKKKKHTKNPICRRLKFLPTVLSVDIWGEYTYLSPYFNLHNTITDLLSERLHIVFQISHRHPHRPRSPFLYRSPYWQSHIIFLLCLVSRIRAYAFSQIDVLILVVHQLCPYKQSADPDQTPQNVASDQGRTSLLCH